MVKTVLQFQVPKRGEEPALEGDVSVELAVPSDPEGEWWGAAVQAHGGATHTVRLHVVRHGWRPRIIWGSCTLEDGAPAGPLLDLPMKVALASSVLRAWFQLGLDTPDPITTVDDVVVPA